jgi:c(7)-type cytochrome triheme protein
MTVKLITLLTAVLAITAGIVFASAYPEAPIVYSKPVKGVVFSHKVHVEKGLSCEMCHPRTFEMQALKAQENKDFTMEALYQGKYCGACHNGSLAFASNTRCATCHVGVKGEKRLSSGDKKEKAAH